MATIGNFLFRYRNGLFPLSLLLVLLPGRALFADPLVAVAIGVGIALSGQLLRDFTIGIAYVVRGVAHALTIGCAVLVGALVILRLLKLSRRIVTD